MRVTLFAVAILLAASQADAASVFKCVDAGGKITFSQSACASGSSSEAISPNAPRPSGTGKSVQLADPKTVPRLQGSGRKASYNHCGDLTQVDIVHAQSNGQLIIGMTGEDVVRAIGNPARINRSASGQQWVYPIDEIRSRYIYIDNNSCFTYWN